MIKNFLEMVNTISVRRLKHPLLGVFISSWILCNWNHLLLLFWGQGTLEKRVHCLASKLDYTVFISFNSFFWLPFTLTIIYIFVLPWILFFAKNVLKHSNTKLHEQNVIQELNYYEAESNLNIAKTIANPNKSFIDDLAKLEIQKRQAKQEEEEALVQEAIANAKNAEIQAKENQLKLDADVREDKLKQSQDEAELKKAEAEKRKFEAELAIQKGKASSNRFPIFYSLMKDLEESLLEDDIKSSLSTLSQIIAHSFGYPSVSDLLDDPEFNNEVFEKVRFIYADTLNNNLIQWAQKHFDGESDDIGFFHDHLVFLFEENKKKTFLHDDNTVFEEVFNFCDESKYDILNDDTVAGTMAETNTIFDEVDFHDISKAFFDKSKGYFWIVEGQASGYHRKEIEIPGQSIAVTVTVCAPTLLGNVGLGDFEITQIESEVIY